MYGGTSQNLRLHHKRLISAFARNAAPKPASRPAGHAECINDGSTSKGRRGVPCKVPDLLHFSVHRDTLHVVGAAFIPSGLLDKAT